MFLYDIKHPSLITLTMSNIRVYNHYYNKRRSINFRFALIFIKETNFIHSHPQVVVDLKFIESTSFMKGEFSLF